MMGKSLLVKNQNAMECVLSFCKGQVPVIACAFTEKTAIFEILNFRQINSTQLTRVLYNYLTQAN